MNLRYRAALKIGQFLPLIGMDRQETCQFGGESQSPEFTYHSVDRTAKKNCFILWWCGCGQKSNSHGGNGGLGTIFIEEPIIIAIVIKTMPAS